MRLLNPIPSHLARHQPHNPLDDTVLHDFAMKCWHERGIPVFLRLEDIPAFEAQAIRNAAEKLYGRRAT